MGHRVTDFTTYVSFSQIESYFDKDFLTSCASLEAKIVSLSNRIGQLLIFFSNSLSAL